MGEYIIYIYTMFLLLWSYWNKQMADDRGIRRTSRVSSKRTNFSRSVVASVTLVLSSSESWSWHGSLSNVRSIRIRKSANVISWRLKTYRIYRIYLRKICSWETPLFAILETIRPQIWLQRVIPVIEEHRFGVSQISERLSFQVVLGTVSFHGSKLSRGEQISARCFNRHMKKEFDDFRRLASAPIFYSLFSFYRVLTIFTTKSTSPSFW